MKVNNNGLIRYVFASSHTTQGYYTFIPDLISDLERVYILKGAPGSGRSTFIRLVGEILAEQGLEVEFWISALDSITPDGVFIPQLNLAVVNGSLPVSIDPRYPGVKEHLINLGEYWDQTVIEAQRLQIIELVDNIEHSQRKAYDLLKELGRLKEEQRLRNSRHMNIEKIDQLIKQLGSEIVENRSGEKHYFAGVLTIDGWVDYVHELSHNCQKRYIFKGPAGSGKSMIIGELARLVKDSGYFLEYYHCGLEVKNLVMVIIRNLQIALIEAGTADIPLKPWDVMIDLSIYMEGYDDECCQENSINNRNLENLLLEARQQLEKSSYSQQELKKIYAGAMDFTSLDKVRLDLIEGIRPGKLQPK
jgi:energy-coupling factor transporter ATP-binding protein EcfA2